MEAFFLQKRFLLLNMKPDLMLKEENFDLRQEIQRKDELLRKHFDKIDTWKHLLQLQDQPGGPPRQPPPDAKGIMGPQAGQAFPPNTPGAMMGLANQPPMMQQIPVQQPMQNPQMFMQQSPLRANYNQNPLDYLMKTANNIDQVGINDGRR